MLQEDNVQLELRRLLPVKLLDQQVGGFELLLRSPHDQPVGRSIWYDGDVVAAARCRWLPAALAGLTRHVLEDGPQERRDLFGNGVLQLEDAHLGLGVRDVKHVELRHDLLQARDVLRLRGDDELPGAGVRNHLAAVGEHRRNHLLQLRNIGELHLDDPAHDAGPRDLEFRHNCVDADLNFLLGLCT